jgi:hypothetical protein
VTRVLEAQDQKGSGMAAIQKMIDTDSRITSAGTLLRLALSILEH